MLGAWCKERGETTIDRLREGKQAKKRDHEKDENHEREVLNAEAAERNSLGASLECGAWRNHERSLGASSRLRSQA